MRQQVKAGANVLAVLTNEGSYGTTPGSDQFIGMTRMRAAELGLDLIHAAVTGKSTVIDASGAVAEETGLGTQEILYGAIALGRAPSPYANTGDVLMLLVAATGTVSWWRVRKPLVGSTDQSHEEE
jgi:apolipoprotein N-acyltransferase